MPEGDTVRRTADRLNQGLAGRELTRSDLRWPTLGDVDLVGRTVLEVDAHGKQILTRIAAGQGSARIPSASAQPLTLRTHLRMDGSWNLYRTGSKPWPPGTQASVRAAMANAEWTAVGVWLGMMDLVPTSAESTLIGHLGPDILAADFADPAADFGVTLALERIQQTPHETIGAALLEQRNLAGIGTFYMAEALFLKGISPWLPVSQVPDVAAVVERARILLASNVVRAVQTTTGNSRPGQQQWVHARSGKPCRRCGTTIRVAGIVVGDPNRINAAPITRTGFYCPSCQPGPTPTDDGKPQRPLGSAPKTNVAGKPAQYRRR
ncbi:Fpg/Nei family DNA glycosylase [Nakamurella antarctica]|uniref:DNA-(apurinic or apyrimidinic site) lyase n=1 Tax=Nakamurella antarctica TaxID=1902245 RepID=A0A3G8ZQ62_9ACTN|nr:DNA-formamidopyrimidine glycosylase family protein [Nakamurella antarctica]AZI58945.1 Fpg/Nei family DNA glycosylase [Nakamurella antarctica]